MKRREFVKRSIGAVSAAMGAGQALLAEESEKATQSGAGDLLRGSFICCFHPNVWDMQYCDACLFWKEENWHALIRDMHDIGMDTVIWANCAFWGRPLFPGFEKTVGLPLKMGCEDPLAAVADEADRLGMKVFYGIGLRGRVSQIRDYHALEKPWPEVWFGWNTALAEAMVQRYGNRQSFGGLYIAYEIDFHDLHVELYEKLVKQHLRPAIGKVKLLASPGNLGREISELDALPKQLERTGIDILAPQDYGGRTHNIEHALALARKNATALEHLARPLGDLGVTLWSNCETFVLNGTPDGRRACMPGPIERIRQQIDIQSPLVEKLITWIYPGVMNRHSELVNIGHRTTDILYQGYVAYLNEKFPGRFRA